MKSSKKKIVFLAGHKGMVGSALLRLLNKKKNCIVFLEDKKKLDLLNQEKVEKYFRKKKIDELFICAARVGGIYANMSKPANFIYENLMISTNLIHAAYKSNIKKILYLGSSCIYPKGIFRPIRETDLLTKSLEYTNESYSIAKISGIKLSQAYNRQYNMDIRCVMPNNLYGSNDNYDLKNSHVIAALIRKFHEAKEKKLRSVTLWGSGKAKREILHVDDLANFIYRVMRVSKKNFLHVTKGDSIINLGSGEELTIFELAKLIKKAIGFNGKILFNKNGLDGTMRKVLDRSRQKKMGLIPRIKLSEGIFKSYNDFLLNEKNKIF